MNTGRNRITKDGIRLYDTSDFSGMHTAGALAANILDMVSDHVFVGQTTGELDRLITQMVQEAGATSATIGYKGYEHASCISVNHVVCHGIPGAPIPKSKDETISKDHEKRRDTDHLKDEDILNIDVTVIVDGWFGDTSRMYAAGKINKKAQRLLQVTHDSLMKAIDMCKPGATFGDIGHAIQTYAEEHKMSVVRDFCGHGIGQVFHAPPNVVHYGRKGTGPVLEEGMIFTIEPMLNLGKYQTKMLRDGWTAVTKDKSLSAQFEHSIGITADGCEIFTSSPKDRFFPQLTVKT